MRLKRHKIFGRGALGYGLPILGRRSHKESRKLAELYKARKETRHDVLHIKPNSDGDYADAE